MIYYITPILKSVAKQHYNAMDKESLYCRFGSHLKPEAIDMYVDNAPGMFYAVMVVQGLEHIPASVLHLAVMNMKELEIGISTLKEYQGNGFAKQLMYFARGAAAVSNADTLYVTGIPDNKPMQALAKSCGFTVTRNYDEFVGKANTPKKIWKDIMLSITKQD